MGGDGFQLNIIYEHSLNMAYQGHHTIGAHRAGNASSASATNVHTANSDDMDDDTTAVPSTTMQMQSTSTDEQQHQTLGGDTNRGSTVTMYQRRARCWRFQ